MSSETPKIDLILTSAILECVDSEDLHPLAEGSDVFSAIAQRILRKRIIVEVDGKGDRLARLSTHLSSDMDAKALLSSSQQSHLCTLNIKESSSQEAELPSIQDFLTKNPIPPFSELKILSDFCESSSVLQLVQQTLKSPFLNKVDVLVSTLHGMTVLSHFEEFLLRGNWVDFRFSHRNRAFIRYTSGSLWTQSMVRSLLRIWMTANVGQWPWKRFETDIEDDGKLCNLVGRGSYRAEQITTREVHPSGKAYVMITLTPYCYYPQVFSVKLTFRAR